MLVNKIKEHLSLRIENGELSNSDMVQLIEHIGNYLNLETIPNYAKINKMSYNGVKKFRQTVTIFKTKYVIDND